MRLRATAEVAIGPEGAIVAHFIRRLAERQGKCIDEFLDTVIDTLRHKRGRA